MRLMQRSMVDLPGTAGPDHHDDFAAQYVDVHAIENRNAAINLGQPAHLQERLGLGRHASLASMYSEIFGEDGNYDEVEHGQKCVELEGREFLRNDELRGAGQLVDRNCGEQRRAFTRVMSSLVNGGVTRRSDCGNRMCSSGLPMRHADRLGCLRLAHVDRLQPRPDDLRDKAAGVEAERDDGPQNAGISIPITGSAK